MMSAKTVSSETPTCPAAAPVANAATTAPAASATGFQNVLAGAVPPGTAQPVSGALPGQSLGQSLGQLLSMKNQQQQARQAMAAGTAAAAANSVSNSPAVKGGVSAADMLQILNDSATLLPQSGAAPAAPDAIAGELHDAGEPVKSDDDILADWLDVMLPPSVFASPAVTNNNAGGSEGQDGEGTGASQAAPAAIASLLLQQTGLAQGSNPGGAPVPVAPALQPGVATNRDAANAGQNSVAVLAAALAQKSDATEKDKPSTDGWMSALADAGVRSAQEPAPTSVVRLATPVHDPRWADALAHRLVLMARHGESVASLKLVPQELGPLDIQISVRDGEASVHFGAAHAETRAVLEASMPRLRDLLSAQGLQLGNASVSHQSAGRNTAERSNAVAAVGAVGEETEVASVTHISTALLDTYA